MYKGWFTFFRMSKFSIS